MPVTHNVVGGTAFYKVYNIGLVEVFLHGANGAQHLNKRILRIARLLRMLAIVAVPTVRLGIFLSEIMQQEPATAHRGLGIGLGFLEQLPPYLLLCLALVLHELLQLLQILGRIESDANALAVVAAGAARLLIVAFEALGYVVVDDKPHVGLVNAHAKGDGSHNDVELLFEKVVLGLRAQLRVQPGMIGCRLETIEL